jgi:hypothetical protein
MYSNRSLKGLLILVGTLAALAGGGILIRARKPTRPATISRAAHPAPRTVDSFRAKRGERGDALLARARRLASIPGEHDDPYFWISSREALFLRHARDPGSFRLLRLDTASGTWTPLAAFNKRFGKRLRGLEVHLRFVGSARPAEIHYEPPVCALSPDGKWFLWTHRDQTPPLWIAATLDGSQQRTWRASPVGVAPQYPVWFPDSRRWVELAEDFHGSGYRFRLAIIHSLDAPGADRQVKITGAVDGIIVGMTAGERVLVRRYYHVDEPVHQQFYEIPLDRAIAAPRQYHVALPSPRRTWDLELSSGDRLAWVRNGEGSFVDRDFTLWVSDAAGEGMRALGTVAE